MRQVVNKVTIEGYLRENNLELVRDKTGEEVIRGSLIIAIDDVRSCRVQFYVNKYKALRAGETTKQENKSFAKLVEVLPGNTMSVASLMKDNASMDFETAKMSATKMWAFASLQEYLRKDEKGEVISSTTIRGISAGVKTESENHPFEPHATFEVEMYIESKRPEMKDGEETGRIVLVGLVPEYDDSVSRIEFVTETGDATDYIEENYEVGQTVKVYGNVINTFVRIEKEVVGGTFGRTLEPQYETKFTQEREIFGGTATPLDEDDELGLKKEEIKKALTLRQQKINELPDKEQPTATSDAKRGFADSAPAAPKKKFTFDSGNF